MDPLTTMPSTIRQGMTFELTFDPEDYPDRPQLADAWNYYLRFAGIAVLRKLGTLTSDSLVLFSCSIAEMATLTPGMYQWAIIAELTGGSPAVAVKKAEVTSGRLEVLVDLDTVGAGLALSQDERILAALRARLEGRITLDQETIQIQGDAIARIPFDQIQALIEKYEARVAAATDPQAFAPGSINLTFQRPGVS